MKVRKNSKKNGSSVSRPLHTSTPKLFLTACSSFWMSASGVMSMLTTARTLILLFTLRISVLVASSFAMVLLARTKFDAEVLANSSAVAWIQDHC